MNAIRRSLMQRSDMKEHLARLHKNRKARVIASNAKLLVAGLVIFSIQIHNHC
jgi:hypothetical protein